MSKTNDPNMYYPEGGGTGDNPNANYIHYPIHFVPGSHEFSIVEFGWKCPECGAINNPRLMQCLCRSKSPEFYGGLEKINAIDTKPSEAEIEEAILDAMLKALN